MVKIFFSLATIPKDRKLFEELLKQFSVQRWLGLIHVLYDSLINPGDDKSDIIQSFISDANIIVLLISPDFFASHQCIQFEMQYALKQHNARAVPIIPVLLRPTDWKGSLLERYALLPANGQAVTLWSDLDSALLEVAQGICLVAKEIERQLASIPTSVKPALFPLCTLPYRHNPFFTDRRDILTHLHRSFTSGQNMQVRMQVLHGSRGVGKTIIAMEYARRHQHEYQALLWLNATPPELLSANILTLADQLGIPTQEGSEKQQRFAAVRDWLRNHEKWLVVLDNVEDFPLVNQLIPRQGSGHVLLITHMSATGEFDTPISVSQMAVEEGALLLLRRAAIISAQGSRIAASEAAFSQALEIAQEIEGYPLALDQAGAALQETKRTLADYLKRYRQRQWLARFFDWRGWFVNEHLDPITITLLFTLKEVARIDPHALTLLRFCAFLHPDALPDEMIRHGASSLTGSLHTIAADSGLFNNALAILQRFSLVHRSADSTTLYMHSIVQDIIRKKLTKKQQRWFAGQAVCLINSIFPEEVLFTTWEACERYLPQAQHCSALIHEFHLTVEEGGFLLERLGFYYYQRGCYIEANTFLTQALRLQEQRQADPLDIAQTLNSLGLLSRRQGRYQDAKLLHQRALELRERVPDHPQIAESLYNLAVLYKHDGQYQEAEQLYLRALSLDERTVGSDHLDTAKTLNNLALIYYLQGDYHKAEIAYQRVLTLYERFLPLGHPDLAYPLNGLGTLAEQRGDDQLAAELYQRALTIREQALGKEHSETAHSISRWARINELRTDYQQAEALYRQALAIGEKTLGPEHPDVALFLNNLALLTSKQGHDQQAESLYRRALSIYELAPKEERPAFASVLNNLGRLYYKTKNEKRAEALFLQALAIREQIIGMIHPDTAQTLSDLGTLLTDQQRYEEAEPFFQRALAIFLQKLGPTYPDVARMREKYASLLELMKRNEEATQLRQAASRQEGETPTEPPQSDHEII